MFAPRRYFVLLLSSPCSLALFYSHDMFHLIQLCRPIFQYFLPVLYSSKAFQYSIHSSNYSCVCFIAHRIFQLPFMVYFFLRETASLVFLFRCLSLRLGLLAPSYRWDSAPLGWSSAFTTLALPVCRQLPPLFLSNFYPLSNFLLSFIMSKISIHNNNFTPSHDSPVAPRTAPSFHYFPVATFHFWLSQIQVFYRTQHRHGYSKRPHLGLPGLCCILRNYQNRQIKRLK